MSKPNPMPIDEFRRLGYVQEVNRRMLHRLGLALAVASTDGEHYDLFVLDDRDDMEGWTFRWDTYPDGNAGAESMELFIDGELNRRDPIRQEALGYVIQPTNNPKGPAT